MVFIGFTFNLSSKAMYEFHQWFAMPMLALLASISVGLPHISIGHGLNAGGREIV
jgi:hypothetical protein